MHRGSASPKHFTQLCRALVQTAVFLAAASAYGQTPPGPSKPSDVPTIRTTSSLVFLDVTVLDQKGRPVVTGLTQDDFLITEDKKPYFIFSFDGPQMHINRPAREKKT